MNLESMYESMNVSKKVVEFCEEIEVGLKERFENQLEKLHEKSKGDN